VPPGSSNEIPTEYISASNPCMTYIQKEEKTCAYDSFASILVYLDYVTEAKHLQIFKKENYHNNNISCPGQVMQCIIKFVTGSSTMKKFSAKKYICKKINSSFNIFKWKFEPGEFIFSTLWTTDGDIGHAICMCDKYIFDSNCIHALDLTKENLNISCNGIFSTLQKGYLFHSRNNDKSIFLSKISDNKSK
jgi:hypothetical protein